MVVTKCVTCSSLSFAKGAVMLVQRNALQITVITMKVVCCTDPAAAYGVVMYLFFYPATAAAAFVRLCRGRLQVRLS